MKHWGSRGGYEIMIRAHSPFLCIFGKLAVGTHHPQIGIKYQPAFDIKINAPTPGIKYQPAFWYKNRHTHPPNCYDIDTNWYLMKWLSLTTYKPDKSNHKPSLWIYDITIEREQACMGNCLKQFNQWKSVNNIHIDKENKSILIKVNF